jgi:NADPH:quinone reductase-like Zn-dependent oxidoreductase
MKAMRFHEFGSSEVLRYEDVDRPVPGTGQVLVRVAATSFNPVDDHIRAGVLAEMIPITLPYVPGIDLAGTVAELGADVIGLEVGDRVVAMLPLDSAGGAAEPARGVRSASLWVRSDGAQLTELVAKVDAGKLRLHVAAHRPVAELAAVHEEAGPHHPRSACSQTHRLHAEDKLRWQKPHQEHSVPRRQSSDA